MDDATAKQSVAPDPRRIQRRAWLWCLLWWLFSVFGFFQLQHHFLIYWDHREPLALSLDAYLDFQPRDRLLELSHCSINYTEAWRADGDADEPPLLLVPLRRDHDFTGAARIVMLERGQGEKLALVKQLEMIEEAPAREAFLKKHYNALFREETVSGWLTPASEVPRGLRAAFEAAEGEIDAHFVLLERDWNPGLRPFRLWLIFALVTFGIGLGQLALGKALVRRVEAKAATGVD
ncbi:hypothetical protein [Acanthopleuribacter pedis]|uniref:Transmembrane protein n=1 Tax=Acanthopleuribacter pedis TaxID=442870 RepID=A0A8J7QIV9_9BACT|nr:hypothetical protein [Acanthopleuribacter pedis]MBO1319015.1 hypothetical protein [Acanthopleuribacter pedis]